MTTMSIKNKSSLMMAFAMITMVFFTSCGDDKCTQEDWIGTYNLEADHACSDTTVTLDNVLVIEADSSSTAFSIDGETVTFTECSAVGPFGITLMLDGDKVTVTGLGCEGEYTRQ